MKQATISYIKSFLTMYRKIELWLPSITHLYKNIVFFEKWCDAGASHTKPFFD